MQFKGKTPCKDCPYRIDAPLRKWDIEEFKRLIENDQQFGKLYDCHKKDDTICRGWLIDQDNRRFPCIPLRLELSKQKITRKYLDNLSCSSPLYGSITEMSTSNYPELRLSKTGKRKIKS